MEKKCFILIACIVLLLLPSASADIVSINSGGTTQLVITPDRYIEGFFSLVTYEPGGWIGWQFPFNFSLTPFLIERMLKPGSEYEENITVYDATGYGALVAEFKCVRDNSCNWARFLIGGVPSAQDFYMFTVNMEKNETIDFVVDMPLEASEPKYEFNVTFSSPDGSVVKESSYVLVHSSVYDFWAWLFSPVIWGLMGVHVLLLIVVIVGMLVAGGIGYKTFKRPHSPLEEEELDEEEEIE
jgi:hypothetical protein